MSFFAMAAPANPAHEAPTQDALIREGRLHDRRIIASLDRAIWACALIGLAATTALLLELAL